MKTTPRAASHIVLGSKEGRKSHRLGCSNLSITELRISLSLNVTNLPPHNTDGIGISSLNFSVRDIPWALPALVNQLLPGLLSAYCPFSLQQAPYNYKIPAPDELKSKMQSDFYSSTEAHIVHFAFRYRKHKKKQRLIEKIP